MYYNIIERRQCYFFLYHFISIIDPIERKEAFFFCWLFEMFQFDRKNIFIFCIQGICTFRPSKNNCRMCIFMWHRISFNFLVSNIDAGAFCLVYKVLEVLVQNDWFYILYLCRSNIRVLGLVESKKWCTMHRKWMLVQTNIQFC